MATTTTAAPSAVGHNSDALKQAWLDECAKFGEQAGAGEVSEIGWMQATVERAYRDEIELDWAEQGQRDFWDNKRRRKGQRAKDSDGKADAVRTSEIKKMIKLGKLAVIRPVNNGGLGVFNDAVRVIAELGIKGELAKLVRKVATEQLRRPETPMTEDDIKSVFSEKDKEDKGEGDYLHAAKKNIELAVKTGNAGYEAHKRAAIASITARMNEINWKSAADLLAEAKALAKISKAKAKGKKK